MLQTQAKRLASFEQGSSRWAKESRNLALLAIAIASGRRLEAILSLRPEHLDFQRNELRIEWEKGKSGRVLPCVDWAMKAAKDYVEKARPVLLGQRADPGFLFVGLRKPRMYPEALGQLIRRVQALTVEENPDLEELGNKWLTSHSLRATFATMLFLNGAGIREVNAMLMHVSLKTTAMYTPLELDDVRRACRQAHPRA
jgi:site-specific recombinase XerD